MAVRSAYNIQKKTRESSWDARQKAQKEAIEGFLKKNPKIRAKIEKAEAIIARCRSESEDANQVIRNFGLSRGHYGNGQPYGIDDVDKFTKLGGKFSFEEPKKWTFDQVMAQLAAADEKESAAILKAFGINWS